MIRKKSRESTEPLRNSQLLQAECLKPRAVQKIPNWVRLPVPCSEVWSCLGHEEGCGLALSVVSDPLATAVNSQFRAGRLLNSGHLSQHTLCILMVVYNLENTFMHITLFDLLQQLSKVGN